LKFLLIGENGQIGWELRRSLALLGQVVAVGRETVDLTEPDLIRETIRGERPNIIINAAAYTAVDRAESEPGLAMAINGDAPGVMAEEAKRLNCLFVHYSTDYVFDGVKSTPYVETDEPNPLNVYGRSKLSGERAIQASGVQHLIFRTSWIYSNRGSNFVLTMKKLFREREELRIVNDQVGAPTWSREVACCSAKAIAAFLSREGGDSQLLGLYHLSAEGQTTWHGFAEAILRHESKEVRTRPSKLLPIFTREYPTAARRPLNSVLSNTKFHQAFGFALPDWNTSLEKFFKPVVGDATPTGTSSGY